MSTLRKSPPWQTYYREVYALFSEDPDVSVAFSDGDEKVLTLYVENQIKADALSALMPNEKDFGGTVVKIDVIPANDTESIDSILRHAFAGNPIVSKIQPVEGVFTNPICYVVFNPAIVQFWDDDLGDLNGMVTMLHEDIAREVFDRNGVLFCTDLIEDDE